LEKVYARRVQGAGKTAEAVTEWGGEAGEGRFANALFQNVLCEVGLWAGNLYRGNRGGAERRGGGGTKRPGNVLSGGY